jgi:hypothetical protein
MLQIRSPQLTPYKCRITKHFTTKLAGLSHAAGGVALVAGS